MNEEKIKEYLNQTDKLEEKLEGKDKETLQWLIFGYNECARLLYEKEQENKQLKEQVNKYIRNEFKLKDRIEKQRKEYQETYKDVREEIKELKEQLQQKEDIINKAKNLIESYYDFMDEKYDFKYFDGYKLLEILGNKGE